MQPAGVSAELSCGAEGVLQWCGMKERDGRIAHPMERGKCKCKEIGVSGGMVGDMGVGVLKSCQKILIEIGCWVKVEEQNLSNYC